MPEHRELDQQSKNAHFAYQILSAHPADSLAARKLA